MKFILLTLRRVLILFCFLIMAAALHAQTGQTFLFPDTLHAKGLRVHQSFTATCPPVGGYSNDSSFVFIDSVGGDASGLSWLLGAGNSRFKVMGDYSASMTDFWANNLYIDTASRVWISDASGPNAEWHDMYVGQSVPTFKSNSWVHHEGGSTPMISIYPHNYYTDYQLSLMNQSGWYMYAANYQADSNLNYTRQSRFAFLIDTGGNAQFQTIQLDRQNGNSQVMYFANNSLPAGVSTDNILTDSAGFVRHISSTALLGGATGSFIDNGTTPQTAHYYVTNTNTNSSLGEELTTALDNFTWNSGASASGGSLYTSRYNDVVHGFNNDITIANSATLASVFNRLTLTSSASAAVEMTAGSAPRTVSAMESQVYLPSISSGLHDSVSDVSAFAIKGVYQDPGTTNSVKAVNYYQLLIESSMENTLTNCLENTYGIYQCGIADTNVLKGPLNYTNKFSSGDAPSVSPSTGAGSSPSIGAVGTTDGGVLTLTTGSSPSANATIATVSFEALSGAFSFPHGCSVVLFPANRTAAGLTGAQAVFATGSAGNWTFTSGTTALAASTTYVWNYQVSGY